MRVLNVLAIAALVGSAIYAYSIKYETIFRAEEIVQLRQQIKSEEDSIAMLRAEWEHISRPERIEALADQFLSLQQPSLRQIVPIEALPDKGVKDAAVGSKPDALSLADPTNTPQAPNAGAQTTPATN
jgi:cell division protein FtsL